MTPPRRGLTRGSEAGGDEPRDAPRPLPTVYDACDIFAKYPKPHRFEAAPDIIQITRPPKTERV